MPDSISLFSAMLLFHPRRIFRQFRRWYHNRLFVASCRLKGIRVTIGDGSILNHCHVKGTSGCEIVVEDNCSINYCSFGFYQGGGRIIIHEGTSVNPSSRSTTHFFVRGQTFIEVGRSYLIAHSVDISTTDFHSVLDHDGFVMNEDASVVIGDHVWIGKRATINKGVRIPNDSVIGASSVVTKAFSTPHVIIAGNPSSVRKAGYQLAQIVVSRANQKERGWRSYKERPFFDT